MTSLAERRSAFALLHTGRGFVIPNPWDAGSARLLANLGFSALATTSAGLQFGRGEPDTVAGLAVEDALGNISTIVEATPLPVNADFQAAYADTAEGVARHVTACVATGVAGLSVEDATGDGDAPLFSLDEAAERLTAAREAIDRSGEQVMLTARAESFLVGHPDPLRDSIQRLQQYAETGADVLYAPGLRTREEIVELIDAVSPLPVNVVISRNIGLTVDEVLDLGVTRISLGSALSRVALAAFLHAATRIAVDGSFDGLEGAASFAELNEQFGRWATDR